MCGILGFTGKPNKAKTKKLLKLIQYRGFDESVSAFECGLNFGMNRLSIQDLTKGYYPFKFKHYSLVFNGEIYNYPEIKKQLESKGHRFKTTCDGEILLPLFDQYGQQAFNKLEGMFAILIIDELKQKVYIARDKTGEKPLYYLHNQKQFSFASELKCLLPPQSPNYLNYEVMPDYLLHGSVSKGQTLVSGIKKLPAAHCLEYDLKNHNISISKYWKVPTTKLKLSSEAEAISQLDNLLENAVSKRLIADVPVGTFLSGGIDSSLVTYYVRQKKPSLNTYSVSFPQSGRHDESDYASQVADLLGTNHHVIPFTADSARKSIANIGSLIDEPIVDPAFMPTLLLAKEARKKVKVVLTGEGADEVFGGYYRYYKYLGIQRLRSLIPFYSSISAWNKYFVFHKLKKLFDPTPYYSPQNVWQIKEISLLLSNSHEVQDSMPLPKENILRTLEQYDIDWYLAEQLLMKVDKATMLQNLESRAPFLDSKVISFGMNLPTQYKIKGIHNKYLLRKVAEQHLGPHIAWRLKHGFSLPLASWFRDELRDIVLDTSKFLKKNHDGLNGEYIQQIITDHLDGKEDHANKIWSLIVLTEWKKSNDIS